MLSIEAIKTAVINASKGEFLGSPDFKTLYLERNEKFSLTYNPRFMKEWYGSLYGKIIRPIEEQYSNGSEQRRASNVIASAVGKSCNRDKIYTMCRSFSEDDKAQELEKTVEDLSRNIKKIIKNHCLHHGKTTNEEHESYAKRILLISNDDCLASDDNRTQLFHINEYPVDGDNVYKKLAILSIIALIPNDANEEQMELVRGFANVCHTQFATHDSPGSKSSDIEHNNIDIADIWDAGKKWYEQTKTEGNRFSRLILNDKILPLVGSIPIYVHEDGTEDQSLITAIKSNTENLYLIGEGGIGKTTSMFSIMQAAYDEEKENILDEIPLYIELSKANSSRDFNDGTSDFIMSSVLKLLSDIGKDPSELREQTVELFSNCRDNQPEIVLLLDGLNEVSRDEIDGEPIVVMLSREIRQIIRDYKNVRIILTSRSKEDLLGDKAKPILLSGINKKSIEEYLEEKGFSQKRIKSTTANKAFLELLRIPLFLTLFAEIKGDNELLTRGEILHAFFAQKRNDLYSERNRAERIREDLEDDNSKINGITPSILSFLLDFVLPRIAWYMVDSEVFHFSQDEIKPLVEQTLTDISDTGNCGEYGKKLFADYRISPRTNVRTVANDIIGRFEQGKDDKWSEITSGICECLSMQLGVILSDDNDCFEFVHQHVRDYFAALYQINRLKLAVYLRKEKNDNGDTARECLNEWKEKQLPIQVLSFIGEALNETHNIPKYNIKDDVWNYLVPEPGKIENERNLIKRAFEIFKYRFSGSDGFAVWNLFQVLKIVRKDLSGEDFTNLDLSNCRANGIRLGNKDFAAKFTGSRITKEFFLPYGHSRSVTSSQFSQNGDIIVTVSEDATVKVWNAKTFEEIATLYCHEKGICSVHFDFQGDRFVTASVDTTAVVWNAKTFEVLGILRGHTAAVRDAQFSHDGNYIVTASNDGKVIVWDAKKYQSIDSITVEEHVNPIIIKMGVGSVFSAQYSPDDCYIVTGDNKGLVTFYDAKTYEKVGERCTYAGNTYSIDFSPNGKNIVVSSQDGCAKVYAVDSLEEKGIMALHASDSITTAKYSSDSRFIVTNTDTVWADVWDTENYKCIRQLDGHKDIINSLSFSNDGKHLVTSSKDNTSIVWDVNGPEIEPLGKLLGHSEGFYMAEFSPDSQYLALFSDDKIVSIWNTKTFKYMGRLKETSGIICVDFSIDAKRIATVSEYGEVKIWSIDSFEVIRELCGRNERVKTAVFSPDGKHLVTCSDYRQSKVWDVETYKCIKEFGLKTSAPFMATYSNDGKLIAIADYERIRLYYADTYTLKTTLDTKELGAFRYKIQFHPSSREILAYTTAGDIMKWDLRFRTKPVPFMLDDYKFVYSIQYNHYGDRLLSIDDKHQVKLWDSKTLMNVSDTSINRVIFAQYSPDGESVVFVKSNGSVELCNSHSFVPLSEDAEFVDSSGIDILNVDLRELESESTIPADMMTLLAKYGAIVE